MSTATTKRDDHAKRSTSLGDYQPLIVIVLLVAGATAARQLAYAHYDTTAAMHDFMGLFLLVFAMFKLFDIRGFADGFAMYDLLAKRFRPYALVYPFVEAALGLAYLAHWNPPVVYTATIVIMLFGAAGVLSALARGLHTTCACMGTVLKVPLSTVALTEDLAMAAMAGAMLAMHLTA